MTTSAQPPTTPENPTAGAGPVVLDIGGDIGALVVAMPAALVGLEVEIIPTGTRADVPPEADHAHSHPHPHPHSHDPGVTPARPPHVAVVARATPDGGTLHSLVFGELREGSYDLYLRPNGAVRLTATVVGGEVTDAVWPLDAN